MAHSVHCAYVDCRSRSDRRAFGRPRPVLLIYVERVPHLLKSHRHQVLCNRHRWVLDTALHAAPAECADVPPSLASATLPPSPSPPTSIEPCAGRSKSSKRTAPTMISMGWHPPAVVAAQLSRLTTAHRALTVHTWNGSTDHLAAPADADISVANGEMQQQPYCDLMHTLITHDNLPDHCKLQRATNHFFLDVGSGYGLAALRASLVSGVAVAGGVEVARDRVFISHRLTDAVELSERVHFVDANATTPDVLPVLRAATHVFAYSAVFSRATRSYLARELIACEDSNWLVYVTFDKVDVLQEAGIKVTIGRHEVDCTEGSVHWVGHTHSLPMSVSGQKLQANIFVRCTRPEATSSESRFATGATLLRSMAAASRQRGAADMSNLMASSQAVTRAAKRKKIT